MLSVPAATKQTNRAAIARLAVHLALIASVAVSLVLEPMITVHIVFGLVFVGLVTAHLAQRRRTTRRLMRTLGSRMPLSTGTARLAWSDAALAALTVLMFGSGLWDWLTGHPTRIRWHAISGVVLTGVLVVHTVRRRRRLSRSAVR